MSKRLILNGKVLPLPPDTELAITYAARDIRNLSSQDGAYAETLTLPDTNEVRAALENSQLVTSGTNTPYRLMDARLEFKLNPVLSGVAGHTEVNEGFAVDVNGLNADFFEAIKGRNLQALDLSDLDHTYSNANVAAANSHDPARGYVYPLINYGTWSARYLDPSNQHFTELFPAVYASTLLERMAGEYTLTGSLLSDSRFQKLVVPFVNGSFVYRESYRAQFDALHNITTQQYYPKQPARVSFAGNTEFTAPVKGRYKVYIELKVTTNAAATITNTFSLRLFDANGNSKELQNQTFQDGQNQTITFDLTTPVLNPGEYLYLTYDPGGFLSNIANSTFINAGSFIEMKLDNRVQENGPVHLEANLPDMEQSDLLLTICNMFNVLIQTDKARKVIRLDLLESIRHEAPLDWSNKIDWTQKPRFVFAFDGYGQRNILAYEELEYEDEFGQTKQDSTIIPIDNERLEQEQEFFISPFTSTELIPAFRGRAVLPFIPAIEVKVGNLGLWRPHLEYSDADHVYWGGNYWHGLTFNTNSAPGYNSPDWELVTAEDVLDYKGATPRLLLLEQRTGQTVIQVGENANGGTFTGFTTQGVFEKADGSGINAEAMRLSYHSITEAMLQKTRITTLRMRLKLPDINQLDFLRPVMLNVPNRNLEGIFYLNKINQFNPENAGSTEVELVRLYGLPLVTGETGKREYSHEYSDEYN